MAELATSSLQQTASVQQTGNGGLVDLFFQAFNTVGPRLWLALGVLLLGIALAWLVGRVNVRLLEGAGVPEAIEGTAFERAAREFGTSTVRILAQLSAWFIVILSIIVALTVADLPYVALFWSQSASFLPNLFLAVLIVIVGVVVGDKAELLLAERLRGVKLPEVGIVPTATKYSIIYVAVVVALDQVGVAILALVVLLGVYTVGIVVFGVVAGKDMLMSGAAGVYLLLNEPYGIGDEVRIGSQRGIVQEVDVLVTRIESDGEEYIVPNNRVFTKGFVRIR